MDIQILQLLEGARQATGITVIIDVFRAFSVEAWLLHNHADRVCPVGEIEKAFAMRQQDPGVILIGERNGRMVEGFDYGNAPSQVAPVDFTGRTVAHTTSAGTQGIANAIHADEILGGSLLTAAATARYIKSRNPQQVSLVCMGWNAQEETAEDTLCARYLQSLLEDRPFPNMEEEIAILKATSGAKFFDPAQQDVFPMPDFELCTRVDAFDFAMRLRRDEETGLGVMEAVCC